MKAAKTTSVEDLIWWTSRSLNLRTYPSKEDIARIASANHDRIVKARDAMWKATADYETMIRSLIEADGHQPAGNLLFELLSKK